MPNILNLNIWNIERKLEKNGKVLSDFRVKIYHPKEIKREYVENGILFHISTKCQTFNLRFIKSSFYIKVNLHNDLETHANLSKKIL